MSAVRSAFLRTVCWMHGHAGIGIDSRCKKCRTRIDITPPQWRKSWRFFAAIKWTAALALCGLWVFVVLAAFGVVE